MDDNRHIVKPDDMWQTGFTEGDYSFEELARAFKGMVSQASMTPKDSEKAQEATKTSEMVDSKGK